LQMYSGVVLSEKWQVCPRGDVPSTSSSPWPLLRGGRATADACLCRSYAACAYGAKPRRGPPAALPGADRAII
jgi:hypothetical protein